MCSSEKQYKNQFKLWKLGKNVRADEARAMLRIQKRRREKGDKNTAFRLRTVPVPSKKLERFATRYNNPHTADDGDLVVSPGKRAEDPRSY